MPDREGSVVMDFAEGMYARLAVKKDKGGWEGCTAEYLLHQMYEHMDKGRVGIESGASTFYVQKHFTDAANYAMMIQDNYCREHDDNGEYRKRNKEGEWE